MLFLSTFIFLLTSFQLDAQSRDEVNAAIVRVRQYLQRSSRQAVDDGIKWLENSGKIGAGYDFVVGSPYVITEIAKWKDFDNPFLD
jgi:hypothetical protein